MFATYFQKLGEIKHTYIISMYVRMHICQSAGGCISRGEEGRESVCVSYGRKGGRDGGKKQWDKMSAIGDSERVERSSVYYILQLFYKFEMTPK